MRNHQRIRPAIILLLALVPAIGTAGWIEEFEGYDVGENLLGQDGWVGAYRVDRGDAYVSSDFAYSGQKSLEIVYPAAIGHEFSGYTSGVWDVSCRLYVPSGTLGTADYAVTVTPAIGPGVGTSLVIDANADRLIWSATAYSVPLVRDTWVEIRISINQDAGWQTVWYGDTLLGGALWPCLYGSCTNEIKGIFMMTYSAGSYYFDDLALVAEGVVAVEETSFSAVKALFR